MAKNTKQQRYSGAKSRVINKRFLALSMATMLFLGTSAGVQAADDWAPNVFTFQLAMAERGHVEAQYLLAGMYEDGHGTDRDMALAMKWYQKAAESGHGEAQQRLQELNGKGA